MKTIRPLKLGVAARVLQGPDHLVVSVTAPFGLAGGERLVTEQKLWSALRSVLGDDVGLDEGVPKARGEVLVHGAAFAPGGAPCAVCQVRITVGPLDKRLAVFGDRHWKLLGMAGPLPFTRMPVDWAHAFGGEGFEQNPEGRGWSKAGEPGALPNVEDPKRLVVSRDDRPEPVGFAPIPMHFASRQRLLGTYDDAWLKRRAPLPPEDLDPGAYNLAPVDQQLREGFFRGDEPVRVENMHPDTPVLEGRLPRVAVRVFAKRKGEDAVLELGARLDTVFLIPDAKMGAMIFRAAMLVEDDEAEDVEVIMAVAEDLDEPRPRAHYEEALARRLDAKKGHLYALRERDLLPPGEPSGLEAADEPPGERENPIARNLRRRADRELEQARAKLRAHGIDPDQHLPATVPEPSSPPRLDEMPEYLEQLDREHEQMKADAGTKLREAEAKIKEAGARRADAEERARKACEEAGVRYEPKQRKAPGSGGGPPKRVEQHLDDLLERRKLGQNAGVDLPDVEAQLADPRLREKLAAAYEARLTAYRRLAHEMPAADALGADASAILRAAVEKARAAGEPLADCDLTGADLRGVDLSGVNLSGALLEVADLSDADLRGANLTRAVLARANLSGADLRGAKLDEANLGKAVLAGARLDAASLRGAVLDGVDLTGASLRGADLHSSKLGEARFDGTDLGEADLGETILIGTKLGGQKLAGVNLARAVLFDCDLTQADLRGAKLERAALVRCRADRADLREVEGSRLCIADHTSLDGADLRGAKLPDASILEASLRGADLSGALLDGANFLKSDLSEAKLYRASARSARFDKVALDRASLVACDLMEASLRKASLIGAYFTGANLFRADLTRARIDDQTRFDEAEMACAITEDQVRV